MTNLRMFAKVSDCFPKQKKIKRIQYQDFLFAKVSNCFPKQKGIKRIQYQLFFKTKKIKRIQYQLFFKIKKDSKKEGVLTRMKKPEVAKHDCSGFWENCQ